MSRLIDLSHDLRAGVLTHPGLPGPEHSVFRSRDERSAATDATFQIDRVSMVGNTGTYLDSPFHRFADGADLAGLPLSAVAHLPVVLVDATTRPGRAVGADLLEAALGRRDLTGTAVLVRTGGDAGWGWPAYAVDAPYLDGGAGEWLAARRPALVGIDAVNVDDLGDRVRPVHTALLGADILVLEHLTNLVAVPEGDSRLHAVPLAWHGLGTWPVRAYLVAA